ncbi:E3 ubiquitin-protein ligase TRIM39 isoform X2 [Microcaecilia unicolor]|uniref:E3 ubiquitin-protein ligase TRIM39-like isoform X2 n=1 Tax=Microcaecilia unicolor TaxID=1415580 RepID=A0A6P7XSC7_9AMPH|nr:E3 ubiquitin-protein ligase TRIM39-like isoform X2 [Microcaecilia unicolor]
MAAANPVTDLQDEATCSICLEYFRDPVSVECGHSFCRPCISEAWRGIYTNFSCPQCRKTSKWKKLRPNRQLANVVEISRRIVAQEQEGKLQSRLEPLRKELAKAQEAKSAEERKISTLTEKVRAEKHKCVRELAQLRQMLSDREHAMFTRLEEAEKRIALMGQGNVEKLGKKISSLTQLIAEIEQKSQQPAKEFLKDVSKTLSRSDYVTFQHPDPASSVKKYRTNSSLVIGPKDWIKNYRVSLTVDPLTAHVQLVLSRDKRTMKYVEDALFFSENPERFNGKPCALARQGFFHGLHYWEVEVGGGVYWTVGAAKESVRRKGTFMIKPSGGIWAIGLLGMYRDEYWAFTSTDTPLDPKESPSIIGVFLDCDKGQISFFNAKSMETLFVFNACFTEKIYPFFCVGAVGTELRL